MKKIIQIIRKIITQTYPFNKYGWKDWYYKNVRQVWYFFKFVRKFKEDIFIPWDIGWGSKNYLFCLFQDHIDRYKDHYFPADKCAEYQVSEFRNTPEKYGMTAEEVEEIYQSRFEPYQFAEKCYRYITELQKKREEQVCGYFNKCHPRPLFEGAIEEIHNGEKVWRLPDRSKELMNDFSFYIDSDEQLHIEETDIQITGGEWTCKFSKLEELLVEEETKYLTGIIKCRNWFWD